MIFLCNCIKNYSTHTLFERIDTVFYVFVILLTSQVDVFLFCWKRTVFIIFFHFSVYCSTPFINDEDSVCFLIRPYFCRCNWMSYLILRFFVRECIYQFCKNCSPGSGMLLLLCRKVSTTTLLTHRWTFSYFNRGRKYGVCF